MTSGRRNEEHDQTKEDRRGISWIEDEDDDSRLITDGERGLGRVTRATVEENETNKEETPADFSGAGAGSTFGNDGVLSIL